MPRSPRDGEASATTHPPDELVASCADPPAEVERRLRSMVAGTFGLRFLSSRDYEGRIGRAAFVIKRHHFLMNSFRLPPCPKALTGRHRPYHHRGPYAMDRAEIDRYPMVVQANRRRAVDAVSMDLIKSTIPTINRVYFESEAVADVGTLEALQALLAMMPPREA